MKRSTSGELAMDRFSCGDLDGASPPGLPGPDDLFAPSRRFCHWTELGSAAGSVDACPSSSVRLPGLESICTCLPRTSARKARIRLSLCLLLLFTVSLSFNFFYTTTGRVLGAEAAEQKCPAPVQDSPCFLKVKSGDTAVFTCKYLEPLSPGIILGYMDGSVPGMSFYNENDQDKEVELANMADIEGEPSLDDDTFTIKFKAGSTKKACLKATCSNELGFDVKNPKKSTEQDVKRTENVLRIQVNGGEAACADPAPASLSQDGSAIKLSAASTTTALIAILACLFNHSIP